MNLAEKLIQSETIDIDDYIEKYELDLDDHESFLGST